MGDKKREEMKEFAKNYPINLILYKSEYKIERELLVVEGKFCSKTHLNFKNFKEKKNIKKDCYNITSSWKFYNKKKEENKKMEMGKDFAINALVFENSKELSLNLELIKFVEASPFVFNTTKRKITDEISKNKKIKRCKEKGENKEKISSISEEKDKKVIVNFTFI